MLPLEIIKTEFCVGSDDILLVNPIANQGINETWRVVLRIREAPIYVKIQGLAFPSTSVAKEAEVLPVLNRHMRNTPVMLASGVHKESGRPFMITSEIPGDSLAHIISNHPRGNLDQVFIGAIEWLISLQEVSELMPMLKKRDSSYSGVYKGGFNPIEGALGILDEVSEPLGACCELFRESLRKSSELGLQFTPRDIVHGSFTTHNLLVSRHCETSLPSLNGVIDHEATRLGDSIFDIATLTFYILLSGSIEYARSWLDISSEMLMNRKARAQALPYILFMFLTRSKVRLSDRSVRIPDKHLLERMIHELCP